MKALGIVRKLDSLGRVVLPIEVRRVNGWVEGTPVEMLSSKEGLMIREYKPDCDHQALIQQLKDAKTHHDNLETINALDKTIQVLGEAE